MGWAAGVQQMEATMGGRDTMDGSRDTRDIILETPLNSWDTTDIRDTTDGSRDTTRDIRDTIE